MHGDMLDKLLLWCAKQEIMVVFGAEATEFDPEDDTIYLEDYDNIEESVHSLLHECGHFIIQNRDDYFSLYRDKLRPTSPTDWYCGFMREERNAWREGAALAEQLQLSINIEVYQQLAETCINQYVEAIRGEYGENIFEKVA